MGWVLVAGILAGWLDRVACLDGDDGNAARGFAGLGLSLPLTPRQGEAGESATA